MAYEVAPNITPSRTKCMRHGCHNKAVWTVATKRWWALYDRNANDGRTGIVFEVCEEHLGVGFKRRQAA